MHACGNPLHDIPLYIMLAIPFVAPVIMWLRYLLRKPPCVCGHDHAQGEQHEP